jgi:hypothetical protein
MSEALHADAEAVEKIMRRAEQLGLSPERVAHALSYRPAEPQATIELERPRRFRRLLTKASRAS